MDATNHFVDLPFELLWTIVSDLTMAEFSAFYRSCSLIYRKIHSHNLYWTESKKWLEYVLKSQSPFIFPPFEKKRKRYLRELLGNPASEMDSLHERQQLRPPKTNRGCTKEDFIGFYSKCADVFDPDRILRRNHREVARRIYYTRIVRDFWYIFGLNPMWNLLFLNCFLAFTVFVAIYLCDTTGMSDCIDT
jgi:hypothetical protein